MANRRMFSLDVVDTDRFLDMSASAQALYFHLGMRADDDGFVSSPRKIAKASNCGLDDLTLLAAKGFIIPFESGVVVVTHIRSVYGICKRELFIPFLCSDASDRNEKRRDAGT